MVARRRGHDVPLFTEIAERAAVYESREQWSSSPWDTRPTLLLLAGCLIAEEYLRKKRGLVEGWKTAGFPAFSGRAALLPSPARRSALDRGPGAPAWPSAGPFVTSCCSAACSSA